MTENPWLDRLVKAERENHCGDAACMTRRVSAAIRVLTGGKEHQDFCWAIEAFEAELGVRDPALIGAEPSNAMLSAAIPDGTPLGSPIDVVRLARAIEVHRTGKWYDPVYRTDFEEAEALADLYADLPDEHELGPSR